ncbi:GlsB/YeaQ/YmgE family stress response membrane protein [Planctomicrobium sp. SH527]|uniref:GlsB/YeaQ/YmgE family stress response membrane protein n=1 Tax=Planctomicrobium sp. SH527 TaxID=3448123 RepID=UPI003F5C89E4
MSTISAMVAWIFFGIFVGLIARMVMPGEQKMGWMATMVLGIVGSFAGGFLTSLVRGGDLLQPANMLMSVLGAIIVLFLSAAASKKSPQM